MTDGIIKGTGDSRYLKTVSNAPTQYPTYETFIQALAAGTLPIDLNGINSTGWTQTGTPLNKANLLADATAALAGLTATATPNTMFAKLANLATTLEAGKCSIEVGSYTGTNATTRTLTFSGKPQYVVIAQQVTGDTQSVIGTGIGLIRGITMMPHFNGNNAEYAGFQGMQWGDNSVAWTERYNSSMYGAPPLNRSGYTYFYMVIIQN